MKYLDRYIAINVITATMLVVAVLIAIESFILFFAEMNDFGRGSYHVVKVLAFVMMQLPSQIYQLFPMAGFLGCLVGLGRLSASSELVVIRASGVSISGISVSVIKAVLIMILVVTLIGETAAPELQSYSRQIKAKALGKDKSFSTQGGIWLRNHNEIIHIDHVDAADHASRISTFVMKGQHLSRANFAEDAVKGKTGWQMGVVKQTDFNLKHKVVARGLYSPNLLLKELSDIPLNVTFDQLLLSLKQTSIDQLSLWKLHQSIKYRKKAKLDILQYQFAFWQRLLQPFISILMICLGVPFVFSSPRNQSMGLRILTGIIVGFAFYTLNQFVGPLAIVYQISPVTAALLPVVIFVLAYGILVRRL